MNKHTPFCGFSTSPGASLRGTDGDVLPLSLTTPLFCTTLEIATCPPGSPVYARRRGSCVCQMARCLRSMDRRTFATKAKSVEAA